MGISIKEAINTVKEDNEWFKKLFITSLMLILIIFPLSLIYSKLNAFSNFILQIVFTAIMYGFIYLTVHRYMNSNTFKILNLFNKEALLTGIKSYISFFVYIVIIYATMIIILGSLIGYFSILATDATLFTVLTGITCFIIGTFFVTTFCLIVPISLTYYLKTLKIRDLFALKTHFNILKENLKPTLILIFKEFLTGILFSILMSLLIITIIGTIFVLTLYLFATFSMFILITQYAKEIEIEKYINNENYIEIKTK